MINDLSVLTCYGLGKGDFSSFYFESKSAIKLFYNYFGVLRQKYSKPLFEYTSKNIYSEYCCYMYSNENAIGEVLIAHEDINIINFPEKTYLDIINRNNFTCKEKGIMEHYKNRISAFERNIVRYSHKEVYFERTLKELIKTKTMKFHCCDEIIPIKLKDSEIVSMLNNIIYRLENHENYSVSIMPDNVNRGYNIIVIDNQIIFFEFISEEGRTFSHIYSEEAMLVRSV